MFFLSHLIYSFSVIYGNTQSLFYELFYELILNPKLELLMDCGQSKCERYVI